MLPCLTGLAWLVGWHSGWDINRLVVAVWVEARSWQLIHRLATPEDVAVVLNVALMVPPAALLAVCCPRLRWWWVCAGIASLSLGIEAAQLVLLSQRSPEWGDVVANAIGGLLGAGLGEVANTWAQRRGQHS